MSNMGDTSLPSLPGLPALLAPYETSLADAETRALTLRTLGWAEAHGVLTALPPAHAAGEPTKAATLVVVASVYAKLCAPTSPPARSLDLAARFTLVFFFIDDAPAEGLAALVSDEADWSVGPLTGALRAWLSELREMDGCPASLRESFTRSFHAYIRARRLEPALVSGKLPLDRHWEIRRQTIFMDPYLDQWLISMGVDTEAFRQDDFADARRTGTDIVLLSNDLGSVDRDRLGGDAPDDLNLVDAYAAANGWTPRETVERLIDVHNGMVARYRGELARALERNRARAAEAYADLLTGVVDGNLGSLRALDFRYRNVGDVLDRLALVR
jgi:hypothetical protein